MTFTRPDSADVLALRRRVAWTFPIAFALHDLEEVVAAGRWQRTAMQVLRRRFGRVPGPLRRVAEVSPRQMGIAVSVVGTGVAAVSALALVDLAGAERQAASGVRPDGAAAADPRAQRLFRAVLMAFTAHGLTHLASSVVLRAYTPGVLTVPLVIAPYSVWAWRTLARSGAPLLSRTGLGEFAFGAAATVVFVGGGQLIGRTVDRRLIARGR